MSELLEALRLHQPLPRHIDHAAADAAHAALMGALATQTKRQPEMADEWTPIRRAPDLFEVLAAVDAKADTDAQRITVLEQTLARVCRQFAAVESDLLVELQTALNETCNAYHDDGHALRVKRVYGLTGEAL